MTAFGIKSYGEEAFNAGQPTGMFWYLQGHMYAKLFQGRYGAPSDIAGLALFLSSPAAAHITGTHTLLDGGSRFSRHSIAPALKL
jgi:NAD(P)-dependent dehydrogenase (short-subunit alcohol dehydrogenase family)